MVDNNDRERLGPAERIINTLLAYSDHMHHGRSGIVAPDPRSVTGVRWTPARFRVNEAGDKIAYFYTQRRRGRTQETEAGMIRPDNLVVAADGRVVGRFQPSGLVEETAAWMYRQVAEVWKLDNEFAARWASYAFAHDHRDLKVVLAAFMLVQSRKGEPVRENGTVLFRDMDYRNVGEAMLLVQKDKLSMSPKLVLRVHDLLSLPSIAAINRELGFGRSTRRPAFGRWPSSVAKWLGYREQNPRLLEGLVKAGYRRTVRCLTQRAAQAGGGFKPATPYFYQTLRWQQVQSPMGHRQIALGERFAADSWENLDETAICQRIVERKPDWKQIVGKLPKTVGITRAIITAAVECGSLRGKDLVLLTPTLEEFGLLDVPEVKAPWEAALKAADDMRAANIAKNVKQQATKEALTTAADEALKKAVDEVARNIRVYVVIDISGSMEGALDAAKLHLARFVQGFPMERLHVSVFNTTGSEVRIPHASATGVERALAGYRAGGGTYYAAGVRALGRHKLQPEEDALFIFVGDEQGGDHFTEVFHEVGIQPMAFGFVRIMSPHGMHQRTVQNTAARLKIPCFMIDERTFADPYAIPRTIRTLVAATPVGTLAGLGRPVAPRQTLVDQILATKLLQPPSWA